MMASIAAESCDADDPAVPVGCSMLVNGHEPSRFLYPWGPPQS